MGFRPFFAAAVLAAVLLMGLWLGIWSGWLVAPGYYGPVGWHAHEMLFGYSGAVIAGFLLTAVRNWTGLPTPTGTNLALLTLVWLTGRILPFIPGIPAWPLTLIDLSFLPLLSLAIYRPLMRAANRLNRVFLPLLAAMALANLLVHLHSLDLLHTAGKGSDLMLNLILILLILISGRVMPFFTEKAIAGAAPRLHKRREQWVFGLIIAWSLADLLFPNTWLLSLLASGVAMAQAWRLYDWHHPKVWRLPILWVLYSGLIWIIIGFVLKVLSIHGLYSPTLALHALTAGAIGIMTLGMMARVALGHTGRDLKPPYPVEVSFILINVAVILRVFAAAVAPGFYTLWIQLSGMLWIFCFCLFAFYYLPFLCKSRIDGRPG
ncbi:MAG: NnrS family protein [Chromatiales bacterium]